MQAGQGVRNIRELLDTIVSQDKCGEFIKEGEIIKLPNLVVTKVNALKEIECCTHVFNLGQLVSTEVKLAFVEGIGELVGMLD